MHGAALVLVIVVAAFLLRTVLVVALRRPAPSAAAFVDRWWVWLPFLVVVAGVALWQPWVALVLTVCMAALMLRDPHLDLPGRRRR